MTKPKQGVRRVTTVSIYSDPVAQRIDAVRRRNEAAKAGNTESVTLAVNLPYREFHEHLRSPS